MKKLLLVFISAFLVSCSSDDSNPVSSLENTKYKNIAYASLSDEQKAAVIDNDNSIDVMEGTYVKEEDSHCMLLNSETKLYFVLKNENDLIQLNQKIYSVAFKTKDDSLLGPITIIVDPVAEKAVGIMLRL